VWSSPTRITPDDGTRSGGRAQSPHLDTTGRGNKRLLLAKTTDAPGAPDRPFSPPASSLSPTERSSTTLDLVFGGWADSRQQPSDDTDPAGHHRTRGEPAPDDSSGSVVLRPLSSHEGLRSRSRPPCVPVTDFTEEMGCDPDSRWWAATGWEGTIPTT